MAEFFFALFDPLARITYDDPMLLERNFTPHGRPISWFAGLLGIALAADAAWAFSQDHEAAALVVGGIAAERLIHTAARLWHGRIWPWRLRTVKLSTQGIEIRERHAYEGRDRSTLLPAGLLLDVQVDHGVERRVSARYVVVIYTILGTILWSEHEDEKEAESAAGEVRKVLAERDQSALAPPEATSELEILPEERAVMWGAPPLVPHAIAARCLALMLAIAAVPSLVPAELVAWMWALVAVTVALLAFPFLGAVSVLVRPGAELAFGATARFGELRAWESSRPAHTVSVRAVRHVGFSDLRLDGRPIALSLVAHTPGASVESFVARSSLVEIVRETYRLAAAQYEPPSKTVLDPALWCVRLPGGVAEAIEAVSWAQRFVAEAREQAAAGLS